MWNKWTKTRFKKMDGHACYRNWDSIYNLLHSFVTALGCIIYVRSCGVLLKESTERVLSRERVYVTVPSYFRLVEPTSLELILLINRVFFRLAVFFRFL